MKKFLLGFLLAFLPIQVEAQFTPTYTFSPGTPILASEVNANFSLLADALNRKGGTITGNVSVSTDVTIDGVDISDYLLATGHVRALTMGTVSVPSFAPSGDTSTGVWFPAVGTFAISLSGVEKLRLSASGLTVHGTAILDAAGKIPGFTSTYFASLDGSAITNIPETSIIDGSILARVAANETITGAWTFNATPTAVQVTQTWDNVGTTFKGIEANITATAYGAASKVVDLRVGGVSKFSIDPTGKTSTTSFQMTTGAVNGYVLTSDASGNASWAALPGGSSGVPSGLVAMFESACPSGWTRRSGVGEPYNNKFVRGGATYSEIGGGSDTHTHTADPAVATSTAGGDHTHSIDIGLTGSGSSGGHSHTISGSTGATDVGHTHSFSTGGPSNTGQVTGGGAPVASDAHSHTGTTGGASVSLNHSHGSGTFGTSTDGTHSHNVDPAAVASSGVSALHSHTVDVASFTTGSGSNVPAHVVVVFCRKD